MKMKRMTLTDLQRHRDTHGYHRKRYAEEQEERLEKAVCELHHKLVADTCHPALKAFLDKHEDRLNRFLFDYLRNQPPESTV